MSEIIPLRIKKHTPKRMPRSPHSLALLAGYPSGKLLGIKTGWLFGQPLVTDISRVWKSKVFTPECHPTQADLDRAMQEHLDQTSVFMPYKHYKGDWSETLADIEAQTRGYAAGYAQALDEEEKLKILHTKTPSWWERLRRKK